MTIRITQRRLVSPAAAGVGTLLSVPIYTQEQSNWCWDACYQMVFAFFKFQITQCNIAQQIPWNTYGNCCGKPQCCNNTCTVPQVAQGWAKWGYTYNYTAAQIAYNSIQTTIDNNQVVEAALIWTSGGGHVVLVIGYTTSAGNYLYVNDPGDAKTSIMTYAYLQSAYGQGSWKYSWNNITS